TSISTIDPDHRNRLSPQLPDIVTTHLCRSRRLFSVQYVVSPGVRPRRGGDLTGKSPGHGPVSGISPVMNVTRYKCSVLVVDDDPAVLALLTAQLNTDFETLTA